MKTLRYPPSIDWELTSLCNHECIHCYNYWRQTSVVENEKEKEYYESVAKKIIEVKPVSVQITGGEPLIVWDKAKGAIENLIEKGINISINTNATLVDDEIAKFLAQNSIDAFVSIPCCDEFIFEKIVNKKGTAKKAIAGIHKLIDNGVRVSLNMVVTKINLPYVYKTAEYVKEEFGAEYFSATKASLPQNANEEFKNQILSIEEFNFMLNELLRVKKQLGLRVDSAWIYSFCGLDKEVREEFGYKRKCTCGKYSFVVDAHGNIKACGCDSTSYGNILNDSFAVAIKKMRQWQSGELLPQTCRECKWLEYCGGGCRADALSTNGTICAFDSVARPMIKKEDGNTCKEQKNSVDNFTYVLNPQARMIEENNMIRISYKTNYEFVSNDFARFLNTGVIFSATSLSKLLCDNEESPCEIINRLSRKKIIIICEDECNENYNMVISKCMQTPYVDDNDEHWKMKYAGFGYSCKRHM